MEDMILGAPSSSNETSDRLSQLPEHIILRILFFLPAKDAARSSILSKTWLSIWDSLPVFSFSSKALSHRENLLKHDAAEADKYMDLINKSLEKLQQHKNTNKGSILENLRQISGAPPVYLEFISVLVYCRPFDFAAFFDCCFWVCRPKTILIKISCETNTDLDDQLQLDKLIPWEENPACCRNSERKCWQHYLDGVKIGETIKMKDEFSLKMYAKHCKQANGIALASSPKSSEVELIAIHLQWKMTGQKRNHRWESSQNLFQEHGFRFILR